MFENFICLKLDALPWRFCIFEDDNFLRIIIKSHGVKYCQKAGKINTARQIQAFEYDKEKKVLQKIINQN